MQFNLKSCLCKDISPPSHFHFLTHMQIFQPLGLKENDVGCQQDGLQFLTKMFHFFNNLHYFIILISFCVPTKVKNVQKCVIK
jgi:hypothetical protein